MSMLLLGQRPLSVVLTKFIPCQKYVLFYVFFRSDHSSYKHISEYFLGNVDADTASFSSFDPH